MSSEVVRISPKISKEIEDLIKKDDNKIYCNSLTSFVNVAVRELLDRIEEKENKIRWRFK